MSCKNARLTEKEHHPHVVNSYEQTLYSSLSRSVVPFYPLPLSGKADLWTRRHASRAKVGSASDRAFGAQGRGYSVFGHFFLQTKQVRLSPGQSYLRAGDFHVAVVDSQTSVWPELQPCSAVDSDSRVRFTLRASSPISKLGQ